MSPEIEKLSEFDNHELVSYFHDAKTGLRGYIAIHNTNLGPSAGGTRYWAYKSKEDALKDALRLSKAMTYKCALAGVPYGGAKAVIIADPKKPKTKEFLKEYARQINLLNGNYITGEDVGIDQRDVDILSENSKFIVGHSKKGGDLGPWAALGVFSALKGALEAIYKTSDLKGRTVAIKGLGKVGFNLAKHIYKNGGALIGADIDPKAVQKAKKSFPGIKIVDKSIIHKQKCDVYAPCAMGGEFNRENIKELKCEIICGGANNQLAEAVVGKLIHERKILYVPDYLANAGGLINVVGELRKGGYNQNWVEKKCLAIQGTAKKIIKLSKKEKKPTSEVADRVAEKIFSKKKRVSAKPIKS